MCPLSRITITQVVALLTAPWLGMTLRCMNMCGEPVHCLIRPRTCMAILVVSVLPEPLSPVMTRLWLALLRAMAL